MVKLELTYETIDNMTLTLLYDGYRTCYWAYRDTQKVVAKWKEIPEDWKEEFLDFEKRLRAYETLVEY